MIYGMLWGKGAIFLYNDFYNFDHILLLFTDTEKEGDISCVLCKLSSTI
jgi:hypothetical protein